MKGYTEIIGVAPAGAAELVERVMMALLPYRLDSAHVVVDERLPTGVRHLLGTEQSNGEDASEFQLRRGRCFELTGWAIALGGVVGQNARLVHGSIQGADEGMERIGHAWLLIGDLVWEPATACFFDTGDFADVFNARAEITYTQQQAQRNIYMAGDFGRWHPSRYPTKKAAD